MSLERLNHQRGPLGSAGYMPARLPRRLTRAQTLINARGLLRLTEAEAEIELQSFKLQAIDRLTQTAMTGHAFLCLTRDVLAGENPILHDELGYYLNVSRMAKAEVLMASTQILGEL